MCLLSEYLQIAFFNFAKSFAAFDHVSNYLMLIKYNLFQIDPKRDVFLRKKCATVYSQESIADLHDDNEMEGVEQVFARNYFTFWLSRLAHSILHPKI